MKRILVTGATGFIGRALVLHLLKQPETAVSLLLRETYSDTTKPLPPDLASRRDQFEAVYADLRNFRLTSRAVRQAEPDVVVHLAAAGVTDPFLNVDTAVRYNVTGMLNLLRACFEKRIDTDRLIVARTPGEKSSMNAYAASKAAAWQFCEMYARTQQWPIVGAMIYQAYGPGQSPRNVIPAALQAALSGQDFPMTAGTQRRDWIFIADVVAGLWQMVNQPMPAGKTADLGTGVATSVADVVRLVYEQFGQGGQPLIGRLPGRPGEDAVQVADVAQTRQYLGWETAVSLRDGISQLTNPR
ncbi:MAG: NAD-dependent epimerase/dehydratase family protein [Chloroflexota bacterium]